MPWTESRSRDEWLAEVRRRGERIRRRRRLTTVLVGAFALVLPVSAVATLMGAEADRGVELSAAGPAPAPAPEVTGGISGPPTPTTAVDGEVPPEGVTTEDTSQPSAGMSPAPTAEVQRRGAAIDGSQMPPRSPTSVPSAGDPGVRTAPDSPSGSNAGAGPPTTVPASSDADMAACPAAEVGVTVTTEKGTYAAGETVRGSSTLENRSSTTCLLPTRAFFRVLDAEGGTVGSFAYTMELRMPVKAAPGKTFTSSFTWDQKNCSRSSCAQVGSGTYVVVADWNESGPYSGRASFQIA